MSLCFLHLFEYLCLYVYYDDTNIVLVTLADVGEVSHRWLGWLGTIHFGDLKELSGVREELLHSL